MEIVIRSFRTRGETIEDGPRCAGIYFRIMARFVKKAARARRVSDCRCVRPVSVKGYMLFCEKIHYLTTGFVHAYNVFIIWSLVFLRSCPSRERNLKYGIQGRTGLFLWKLSSIT